MENGAWDWDVDRCYRSNNKHLSKIEVLPQKFCLMHTKWTGDSKYLNAAIKAGDYLVFDNRRSISFSKN